MKLRIALFLVALATSITFSNAQSYNSLKNGAWTNAATWNRKVTCPPDKGDIEKSNHPNIPPVDSSKPDCPIDLSISHEVSRTGATTFSQKFRSLIVTTGGKLTFTSNHTVTLTNNSYDGVEFTIDGGTLEVYDLAISNGAKLRIINGGKVIVKNNLSTSGGGSLIELDNSSTLEVKNSFTLGGSKSDVILSGTFSAKSLTNTGSNSNQLILEEGSNGTVESLILGGSTTNVFAGKLKVSNNFELDGSSTASIQKTGSFTVDGNSTIKSSTPMTLSGNAQLKGTLNLSGNSSILASGNLLVGGNTSFTGSSNIKIPGFATFEKDVNLSGGGTLLEVSGDGDVLIKGDLVKPQYSATITVRNKGSLVICNDRVNGTKSGAFPPTTYSNMNIAPAPAFYGGCRILPVEFSTFQAALAPSQLAGNLSWATTKEWENSHFEIERSVNDVQSWEKIGEVTGAGYSDAPVNYTFQDMKLPSSGGNVFYRLKQVDFSNKFVYSQTRAIRVEPTPGNTSWNVYPNPTTGNQINLKMLDKKAYRDELIRVRVIFASGQFEVIEGRSESLLSSELAEKLKNKPAGIFTLEISWGFFREYHKVILRP